MEGVGWRCVCVCGWWGWGVSRQRADTIKTRENELLNTSIKKYKTWPRFFSFFHAVWAALQAGDKVLRLVGLKRVRCAGFSSGRGEIEPTCTVGCPCIRLADLINARSVMEYGKL